MPVMLFLVVACAEAPKLPSASDTAADAGDAVVVEDCPDVPEEGWFEPAGWTVEWTAAIGAYGPTGPVDEEGTPSWLQVGLYSDGWNDKASDLEHLCLLTVELADLIEDQDRFEAAGAWTGWVLPAGMDVVTEGQCSRLDPCKYGEDIADWFHAGTWGIGVGPLDAASDDLQAVVVTYSDWDSYAPHAMAGWLYQDHLFESVGFETDIVSTQAVFAWDIESGNDDVEDLYNVSDWEEMEIGVYRAFSVLYPAMP